MKTRQLSRLLQSIRLDDDDDDSLHGMQPVMTPNMCRIRMAPPTLAYDLLAS
jgi:hypothetical protein